MRDYESFLEFLLSKVMVRPVQRLINEKWYCLKCVSGARLAFGRTSVTLHGPSLIAFVDTVLFMVRNGGAQLYKQWYRNR
ncbi:MAG: hypothetical protein ACR2PG_12845 [Hyphomicrobiaceae bacterium]